MNRDQQLTDSGFAYARPFVPVGATSGADEDVFAVLCDDPLDGRNRENSL